MKWPILDRVDESRTTTSWEICAAADGGLLEPFASAYRAFPADAFTALEQF